MLLLPIPVQKGLLVVMPGRLTATRWVVLKSLGMPPCRPSLASLTLGKHCFYSGIGRMLYRRCRAWFALSFVLTLLTLIAAIVVNPLLFSHS